MSYTITLNRAHKIVERIRQHVTDTSKALRAQVSPVRVRSQQDVGSKARVEARQEEFPVQMQNYGKAVETLELLRNAISKGNISNGVDVLLTRQNRINQELTLVKELISDAALESCVEWEHIAATPSDYETSHLASLSTEQGAILVQHVRTLQTELHSVSDQVSDANRATITVELSDEHARIVGLKA
jgi:hypothetical protein